MSKNEMKSSSGDSSNALRGPIPRRDDFLSFRPRRRFEHNPCTSRLIYADGSFVWRQQGNNCSPRSFSTSHVRSLLLPWPRDNLLNELEILRGTLNYKTVMSLKIGLLDVFTFLAQAINQHRKRYGDIWH